MAFAPLVLLAAAPLLATSLDGDLDRVLEKVGPEITDAKMAEAATALARRPNVVPDYLARMSAGDVNTDQGRFLAALAPVLDSSETMRALQDGLTAGPDLRWRYVAVDLFALHAGSSDLSALAGLVTDDQGKWLEDDELAERFQAAAEAVLRREGATGTELRWLSEGVPALRERLVHAVGRSGDVEGLPHLVGELADAELADAVLMEIGRLAPETPPALARQVAPSLRPFLKSESASQRRSAIRSLGVLGDAVSVPQLIPFLEEGRPKGERSAAHSALKRLSSRDLPDRADVWKGWFEGESRWFEEETPRLIEELAAEEDARVVAALQELSSHPLFRDELARTLAVRLGDHPSAAVRSQLCLALGRLGSHEVLGGLVQALEDEDESVRAQAHAALVTITGLDLPQDPVAWSDELLGA